MAILEKIKELCEQTNLDYKFVFESAEMMNRKADDVHFPVAYFEEYNDARIRKGFGLHKQVRVELHLLRLAPFQCSALVREKIREQIEAEFALPFIERLNRSGHFDQVSEFDCMPVPPMFDANAVGVMLRFWASYKIC